MLALQVLLPVCVIAQTGMLVYVNVKLGALQNGSGNPCQILKCEGNTATCGGVRPIFPAFLPG